MFIQALIIFIVLGISSGILSYFIDFCFNDGNIFDFYYNWIVDYVEPVYPKLAKPLGLCNVCFNFWVSTFLFVMYYIIFSSVFLLPFSVYISFFMVYTAFSSITSMFLNLKLVIKK